MPLRKVSYHDAPDFPSSVVREDTIEYGFIGTLQKLKYEYRPDIINRATLEANFREKFESLNRVHLTDSIRLRSFGLKKPLDALQAMRNIEFSHDCNWEVPDGGDLISPLDV